MRPAHRRSLKSISASRFPYLHRGLVADFGVAIGVASTEATKKTTGMIPADDHFCAFLLAVRERRDVSTNPIAKEFVPRKPRPHSLKLARSAAFTVLVLTWSRMQQYSNWRFRSSATPISNYVPIVNSSCTPPRLH